MSDTVTRAREARILTSGKSVAMPNICACCTGKSDTSETVENIRWLSGNSRAKIALKVPTCSVCQLHRAAMRKIDLLMNLSYYAIFVGLPCIWTVVFARAFPETLRIESWTIRCLLSELVPFVAGLTLYLRFWQPKLWKLPTLGGGCANQGKPLIIGWAENNQFYLRMLNVEFARVVGALNRVPIELSDVPSLPEKIKKGQKTENTRDLLMSPLCVFIGWMIGFGLIDWL